MVLEVCFGCVAFGMDVRAAGSMYSPCCPGIVAGLASANGKRHLHLAIFPLRRLPHHNTYPTAPVGSIYRLCMSHVISRNQYNSCEPQIPDLSILPMIHSAVLLPIIPPNPVTPRPIPRRPLPRLLDRRRRAPTRSRSELLRVGHRLVRQILKL